ncbi:MAG: SDR family oxidoreductase [Phototrophicaceae bacterium]
MGFLNILITIVGTLAWIIIIFSLTSRLWRYIREQQMLDISNRWVIVTGCDTGIGFGVMKKLLDEGASVIAFNYTEQGAQQALKLGAKLAPWFDITDEDAVKTAVREVEAVCEGKIWGLVHNAGLVRAGFIEYQPLENYHRLMDVNFYAVVNLTQQLIPLIKPTQGRIVVVSSVDGIVSLPGNAPYDAAKFAVEAYVDALRIELSYWGVNVAVINPSTLKTPLAMSFFETHRQTWEAMDKLDPEGKWKQTFTAEWLDSYVEQNTRSIESIAEDPQKAVKNIFHAIAGKYPRMRYLSGRLANTIFYALWVMPEHLAFKLKKGTVNPLPNIDKT